MTSTTSTKLFDQALIAAEKAATRRFTTAKLSVPEELDWYTNNTDWDALDRKEFRDIMIRMETITVQYYEDFGTGTYPSRSAAIKRFWAEEWGCEYLPESGKWLDLTTNTIIKSETEKQAEKAQKKALKKQEKEALKKEEKKNKKALKQQLQQQQQDAQFDEEEEAYAEAYAQARLAEEAAWQEAEQARAQKELAEAQAYLDSFDYTSEEEEEEEEEVQPPTQVPCQGVLYIEELTNTKGDPDWRAFIYYDARIRRYVLKGTRRSLRATGKKTVYPEVTLCFRSSRELARYLCSSTDSLLNVTMYAMSCGALAGSTFGELYTQPLRGYKTELFGYDSTRPRYSTFVDYLSMVRDLDAGHSTFASF